MYERKVQRKYLACAISGHVTIRGGEQAYKAAEAMGLSSEPLDNGNVIIEAENKDQILDILNWLKDKGIKYDSLDIRKANLEEVFLTLTGEELSAGGEGE